MDANTQRENEDRVAEEYLSSLSDLNCNSKPLINMLTMLAEENIEYAGIIVKVVEQHIAKVQPEFKLPILYLIDSIVKNVKSAYVQLFSQCIVSIFCGVFEKVNEKIRERMYALRQTWNEVFAAQKLYTLDVKVKLLDNNWPITAKQPSIHVNPNFLKTVSSAQAIPTEMEKILQDKTRELLELKKRKLELELEATKKHLEEQEKQFSKTAEGVIPPVEALVAAGALQTVGVRGPAIPAQMMPGIMAPGYMGGHQSMAVNPAMRPNMFHHNMRVFRPNLHPKMMNVPPQGMPTSTVPPVSLGPNKPKVHPVNPALLNSVRQRDPRLLRQQQQQQQQQQQMQQQKQNSDRNSGQQNIRSVHMEKDKTERNHKSSHKSPTKASSSATSSSNRSSGRSGKSSQRDKDRDRKRSESKSSTTSNSSAGSAATNTERKKGFSSSSKTTSDIHSASSSSKCDKDAFEIAPLSTAFKRKSSSPTSSPSKSRDSKRYNSHKSRNSSRSKTRSRSRSPDKSVGGSNTTTTLKDVDLRRNSTSSASSSMITSPDKRPKISDSDHETTNVHVNKNSKEELQLKGLVTTANDASDKDLDKTTPVTEPVTGLMDIDLRPHFVVAPPTSVSTAVTTTHAQTFCSSSSNKQSLDLNSKFTATTNLMTSTTANKANFFINIDEDNILSTTSAKNIVATSSPKVSFKIQKIFNKLEKSTENILSAAASSTSSVTGTATGGSSRMNMDTVMDSKSLGKIEECGQVSKEQDDDGKKRPSAPIKDEEPLAKKSKSTKLDPLFGSEDVDLRQLIPPIIAPNNTQEETAPPPPPINISTDISRGSNENWDNVKTDNNKNTTAKVKSSLEDVRAKLAKTAKFNKISKLEKPNKDIDHRNKLAELQMNEDTQEANDEKIRTMITQAQELLEAKSINQEQYKNLVTTVMSINEVNKLQEAKRRESLNAMKQKINDEESNDSTERNTAIQAVLKKRIPKLNKTQTASEQIAGGGHIQQSDAVGSSGNAENSPRAEDKTDSNDEQTNARMNRNIRDKRGSKMAKWGERALEAAPAGAMMPTGAPGQQLQQQRPWNTMMGPNKRGGFRGNAPQNVRPPWAMGPGGNVNGPAPPPPQFIRGLGPMPGHMRGNILPPQLLPPQVIPPPPQPPVIPKPCNSIDNPQEDLVRTITIDGAAKEIRFYDQIAIVFMEVDQPREIGFQNGQRNISIDNNEPIMLQFNDDYKTVTMDGEVYKLRFGFPSRELYIDENWYEIYFGGPPISVPIRNKMHMLKAEGPPPQVNIGPLRRDLVVGKINMIVDALNVIPIFLDARLQTFRLGDKDHTIQFADCLLTVLLDGTPTRVEYGGLPKSLFLGGKKYFVRFGALPQGVVAGKVQIKDMIYVETSPPLAADATENATAEEVPPPPPSATLATSEVDQAELQKTSSQSGSIPILPAASLTNINIDELFQKLVSTGILGGGSSSKGGVLPAINTTQPSTTSTAAAGGKTNELDKSANNSGSTTESNAAAEELTPLVPMETIKPIDLSKSESIKTRQAAIVATLFTGMQCSSCGVRFPPEQTIKYSQHLDWHFRQNRRERDTSRKAHARKWYYDLNDWVQYEEIEDMEERDKNFFEAQTTDLDTMDETSNQRSTNSPIPTCPAGPDDVDRECDMCQEKFEQFYNNELEEWHLRGAIRVEDKIYHPLCYEDYKTSLNPPTPKPSEDETTSADKEISLIQIDDDNAVDIVIKVEEDDDDDKNSDSAKIIEDDDDDVIVLPNEEPSVTEIVDDDDDDEYIPANVTREQMGHVDDDEDGLNETTESDVEIQEPNIPFTDLDTYVEKELPEGDDNSQLSFMRMKIKEEPKEDEDEDDGFEEVGTVVIAPEEISINSSEDTQTHIIDSSTSATSPIPTERPASRTSLLNPNEENEPAMEPPASDLNISMDGNMETGNEHNLSAAGPAPTVPLASLVNKIKINITKNNVTTSSNTNSSSATISSSSALNSAKSNQSDSLGHSAGGIASNPIPTISTIPVLCGGGTTISSISSSIHQGGGGSVIGGYDDNSVDNSVSTISVIGSYGSTAPTITHISRPVTAPTITIAPKAATPPPPPQPIEETITFEVKPALQKVSLRKKEKVVCGNETSGLCSIM